MGALRWPAMARGSSVGEWGVVHRGGVGQWSFFAHRVSGVALAFFFLLVTLDVAFVFLGAEFYDRWRGILDTAPVHLVEVVVLAALLFHALDGLRTIAVDLSPRASARHRSLFNVQMGVFVALFVPGAWIILHRFFDLV